MEHSIALVTGTTSGVGYEAARLLAAHGYRQVIVTGRSLARVQATAAQLAAQTGTQVFTPLELELDEPASVQAALAELVKRGQPIDVLLLNAGMVPGKERVITAAGVEASQAPLIGHHQLTVGLLRANLLSPNARIVIASAEPARGGRTHVQIHRRGRTRCQVPRRRPDRRDGSSAAQRASREICA
ncbi:SDR family NAD(P)-dependent oxidoreductase [Burkholderia metallica]|uniref:SDR family NAD(P)-dependent oxidoreductase n=1 Tax=Burkholderia metallica TaxID=488729 RepID=UPI0018FE1698|nr:SDR family NAD(P)-dependent oxidoreductase [Burkholderia metallica]